MKRAGMDGSGLGEFHSVDDAMEVELDQHHHQQIQHQSHHHRHQRHQQIQDSNSRVLHGLGEGAAQHHGGENPPSLRRRTRMCKSSRSYSGGSSSSSSINTNSEGDDYHPGTCSRCRARLHRHKEDDDVQEDEDQDEDANEEKLRRVHKRDLIELGRSFQRAVSAHSWDLAESYIQRADMQRLNDGLCIALDSVWFLSTQEELARATRLIEKIIGAGANDYNRATVRTSFLASCVSACRSRTMSLADTVTVMAQRLRDRLQECNGDEELKAEAAAKVHRFREWALRCIGSHSRGKTQDDELYSRMIHNSMNVSRLQLMAFERFLRLASENLSGKDYTEAFDAACFPLTLFSSAIDPGWASGIAASAMQGLLGMLLERGADNANQCFLEAARFGSTELVRILLQIAQRSGAELDVDLALGFASHYCKMGTMECLVQEGNATSFLGPLMRAAERGCLEVVEWFVARGCKDMELCLALTAATSSSRLAAAAFLLRRVPRNVLVTLAAEILKAASERSTASLRGIDFLLHSDFVGDAAATYRVADSIACAPEDDSSVTRELRAFLHRKWSRAAFASGRLRGQDHHVNFQRALKRGTSPLSLQDLPLQLQASVAYLPLYKECVASEGVLLSQLLRGQMVEAVSRIRELDERGVAAMAMEEEDDDDDDDLGSWSKEALLSALERRLPPAFLLR